MLAIGVIFVLATLLMMGRLWYHRNTHNLGTLDSLWGLLAFFVPRAWCFGTRDRGSQGV